MSLDITAGTMMIRKNTPLPVGTALSGPSHSSSWRFVRGLDRRSMHRELRSAGWTMSCMAGEVKVFAFGATAAGTRLRALNWLLRISDNGFFNTLEVTGVTARRFLGIPFVLMRGCRFQLQDPGRPKSRLKK